MNIVLHRLSLDTFYNGIQMRSLLFAIFIWESHHMYFAPLAISADDECRGDDHKI